MTKPTPNAVTDRSRLTKALSEEESPSDHHREGGIDPEVEEFHGVAEDHGKDAAAAGRIGGRRGRVGERMAKALSE